MPARLTIRTLIAFAFAFALAIAPAPALASRADLAATHAYIRASYALAQVSVARIPTGQARIETLNGELARECPHAGEGSLQNEASQPVSAEVAAALWSLDFGTDAAPIRTFLGAVGRLHWSNRAITLTAQRYARSLEELATLPLPNLCQDVRSWRASGFQVIPSSTLALDRRAEGIEPKSVAPRLLAPYERGADRSLQTRTLGLEMKLEENEFVVGQSDWIQLLQTLSLNE